ncbi:keratin, type I cytoskeletal 13-like [Sphaeramia orbicularis]|uniref:keratin, type I cytoskeletal 13-like n=1 Tax=Sphaeramia orbicularis TaxID=375764 RepID=UPI00117DD403|nr:keratin, type I cytoskeletal 13-like [Sphaeramia orbicularis]
MGNSSGSINIHAPVTGTVVGSQKIEKIEKVVTAAAPALQCEPVIDLRPPTVDEKFWVQTLDTCLLDYLSTVRSLEDANAELELKIRQWVESSGDSASRDYSTCFQTMSIIRSKIQTVIQVYGSMGDAQTADEHLKNKSVERLQFGSSSPVVVVLQE